MQRPSLGLAHSCVFAALLLGPGAVAAAPPPSPSATPASQVVALGPIGRVGTTSASSPMPETSVRTIRAEDARAEGAAATPDVPGHAASGAVFWALGAMLAWIAARRG
jgi:hypothetical protein